MKHSSQLFNNEYPLSLNSFYKAFSTPGKTQAFNILRKALSLAKDCTGFPEKPYPLAVFEVTKNCSEWGALLKMHVLHVCGHMLFYKLIVLFSTSAVNSTCIPVAQSHLNKCYIDCNKFFLCYVWLHRLLTLSIMLRNKGLIIASFPALPSSYYLLSSTNEHPFFFALYIFMKHFIYKPTL